MNAFRNLPLGLNFVTLSLFSLSFSLSPLPYFSGGKSRPYRPRDGQLFAASSAPADVRGRHHRNCNETVTAKERKKKVLSGRRHRIHTNNANPHRLQKLSLAVVPTHPHLSQTQYRCRRPLPNATPPRQCWTSATRGAGEAKVLQFFMPLILA